jgi:AcrR family transcriptional regulator
MSNISQFETRSERPMRADARRNEARLLAAAGAAFGEHGTNASLDDIARRAGVGIGTLYRHFATREALAEAVYRDQIEALCAQAGDLLSRPSPEEALAIWLRAVVSFGATKRGVAELLRNSMQEGSTNLVWCKDALRAAGAALLARAQDAGSIRRDADISDLLRLSHAIGWAVEQANDGVDRTDLFLRIMLDGLRRQEPAANE